MARHWTDTPTRCRVCDGYGRRPVNPAAQSWETCIFCRGGWVVVYGPPPGYYARRTA